MKPSHSHSESAQPLAPHCGQYLNVSDAWIHLHNETSGGQHSDEVVWGLLGWSLHVLRELSTVLHFPAKVQKHALGVNEENLNWL